ncbi:MAG TPA: sigma-70 family RNA polymerase sigma factor [Candidatus Polarisedimenticolia bacterium]|nr:sigma-70 family RNA polymerase sigma factor [Candidatus Polarisedimenticolia bacterium]
MPDSDDRALLDAIAPGGPAAWQAFLDSCSATVFRVVRLFADTYDERMDLFLFVCSRLHADDMRRLRSFRYRPEAPCRFSTWLTVVVKNLAVDYLRSKQGRDRPFRNVEAMDEIDRLVFDYHLRDGRPLREVRQILGTRHGLGVGDADLAGRAARVEAALSASQRWRLLARLAERREHLPLDPVSGAAVAVTHEAITPTDAGENPEQALRHREEGRALRLALLAIPPRERLAVTLRHRDGLSAREVAAVLKVTPEEAERLARAGAQNLRERLGGATTVAVRTR